MLTTRITRDWGLRFPLIQAPMAGAAGGSLAAAVTRAGGLGMIGVGSTAEPEWIATQATQAREAGNFGMGVLLWALKERPHLLDVILEQRPFAVSLSFADPGPHVQRVHDVGALAIAQVQTASLARQALDAGVDAIVAQGTEAGGHTGSVSTLTLLQEVLEMAEPRGVPVVAAGGIATGRAVAAALAMGAEGVWVGTRFAATEEAITAQEAKAAMVAATSSDTVLTHVFDIAQGAAWPDEFPGRALSNAFTQRWHGREDELKSDLQQAQQEFQAAREKGDVSRAAIYAGQATGMVDRVAKAAEVVNSLMREAEDLLRARVPRLLET